MVGHKVVPTAASLLLIIFQAYAEVILNGKAFGAGYLQNCTVCAKMQRGFVANLCHHLFQCGSS
jgi:hypothetical protein